MSTIIPATKGITAVERFDPEPKEIAQKNAALWIQYSCLFIGRSSGTELLDNGGYATVPVTGADAPRHAAERVQEERTKGGGILKNEGGLSIKKVDPSIDARS